MDTKYVVLAHRSGCLPYLSLTKDTPSEALYVWRQLVRAPIDALTDDGASLEADTHVHHVTVLDVEAGPVTVQVGDYWYTIEHRCAACWSDEPCEHSAA